MATRTGPGDELVVAMQGVGGASVLAGASLLVGSAAFLVAFVLVRDEPASLRTARSLAFKLRVTWVVVVLAAVAVCAGLWLDR
ncbi:hypothetical protein [Lentzea sp. NBRC 102530]|uniref:hypothetical protein n=1 Tax=Lentzea sp. NBRC 102530 TaxID=3032201 RepID=UPI0024A5C083|nr:hypothetical protein [Lentzea sp. NBRC 102530]GLY50571.1 hypothetical protein Lesp01_42270 [Lentzea sp. NBRC 102530]